MPVGPTPSASLSRGIAPVIHGGESFPPISLRPRQLLLCGAGWRPKSGVGMAAEPAPSLRVIINKEGKRGYYSAPNLNRSAYLSSINVRRLVSALPSGRSLKWQLFGKRAHAVRV
ncbi:hypothetical protein NDU88_002478 [Pleurodeles waltl]|uniref:Uncharacterized protein n=1 Tax=Pleurodeles waltl TaxID=8319 RepID=A0AAV7L3P4_PLEWA|nr:hypothetical protein NDU88_002478 [Pleurodeles waltl]